MCAGYGETKRLAQARLSSDSSLMLLVQIPNVVAFRNMINQLKLDGTMLRNTFV